MVEINCFHTCRNYGNRDEIIRKVPFLSNKDSTQWLGQGFYLWRDSYERAFLWKGTEGNIRKEEKAD